MVLAVFSSMKKAEAYGESEPLKNSLAVWSGMACLLLTYTVWGLQPLYWKALRDIPLMQVLSHRILWSLVLLLAWLAFVRRLPALWQVVLSGKYRWRIVACALLIGSNWLLNVYAPYHDMVVEASMGQYLTPIVVIIMGIVILKERVRPYEIVALAVALSGVAFITFGAGEVPVIALLLVATFAAYIYFKKTSRIDDILGITAEMLVLAPLALGYVAFVEFNGEGVLRGADTSRILVLLSTAFITAIPLALFSYGVRRVNLSRLGFIQYYSPSLSLLVAVFAFGEPFTKNHMISFSLIWSAIAIVLLYPLVLQFAERRQAPKGN